MRILKKEKVSKSKQGKKNRAAGARFELKVRARLEAEGWIIDKWTNNVDLEEGKLVKAKPKFVFNPKFKIRITIGMNLGFPDFIAFKNSGKKYEIIGVEVKGNGFLDKQEKEKCKFLLKKKIFNRILIAKKGKKRVQIEYMDFEDKYNKT